MNQPVPTSPNCSQRKRTLRYTLFALPALLAVAVAAECVLRYGVGLGNPVLVTPDAACNYIVKPDQDITRFFRHTHINHYGMRSNEVPPTRTPHTLRVMFVGDSITYGTSRVGQSEIFAEVVQRELPSVVHEPVEVLNASASSWAIDNELSYIRSRGIFQSDEVLLVLNSDDLAQPRATIQDLGDDLPVKRPATALGELYMREVKVHLFHAHARTDAGETSDPGAQGIIQANLADLDAFRALVAGQHARFAIVYVPFRKDIPEDSSGPASVLRGWAAAHQVPFLDLTEVEAKYSPDQITLGDGMHLNAAGHRMVATEIENSWARVAVMP